MHSRNLLNEALHMCVAERYDGSDDYRLFYRGQELESIEREKLTHKR